VRVAALETALARALESLQRVNATAAAAASSAAFLVEGTLLATSSPTCWIPPISGDYLAYTDFVAGDIHRLPRDLCAFSGEGSVHNGSLLGVGSFSMDSHFGAGSAYTLASVYDAAGGAFIAPHDGVFSLAYALVLGVPVKVQEATYATLYTPAQPSYVYSGSASLQLVIAGAQAEQLEFVFGPTTWSTLGARHYIRTYATPTSTPAMYWYTSMAPLVRGTWTGLLAAGQRVSLEVEFTCAQCDSITRTAGMVWGGSKLRFFSA